jgi:hypothetical protein
MTKNSIYKAAFLRRENRLNTGYNYKNDIIKNTTSSQLHGINETMDTFLKNVNDVMYENIEAVKQIKIFANPALDKYENKLN